MLGDHAKALGSAAVMGAAIWWVADDVDRWTLLPVCAGGAVIYLGLAHALGLRESRALLNRFLKKEKGLPPTIDPESQRLLARLAFEPTGPAQLVDGAVRIPLAEGVVIVAADGERLAAAFEVGAISMAPSLTPIRVVMRVGAGPPTWTGLLVGSDAYRLEDGRVVEGLANGIQLDPSTGEESAIPRG